MRNSNRSGAATAYPEREGGRRQISEKRTGSAQDLPPGKQPRSTVIHVRSDTRIQVRDGRLVVVPISN